MFASTKVRHLADHALIEDEFLHRYHGNFYDGLPTGTLRSRVESFEGGAGVTFARWDYPTRLGYDPVDYVRVVFPLDMRPAEFTLGNRQVQLTELGHVVTAGRPWSIDRPFGSDSIALRVDSGRLASKLSVYLGETVDAVNLRQPTEADPVRIGELRAALLAFCQELDVVGAPFYRRFSAQAIERLYEQILLTLCDEVIAREDQPAAPSSVQLGRVEQYLAAHFADAITLETIADISGTSGRSVCDHFRRRHGCTVRDYVGRLRLEMARLRISIFKTAGRSLETVALDCGFPSVAALQRAYLKTYGVVLPDSASGDATMQKPQPTH